MRGELWLLPDERPIGRAGFALAGNRRLSRHTGYFGQPARSVNLLCILAGNVLVSLGMLRTVRCCRLDGLLLPFVGSRLLLFRSKRPLAGARQCGRDSRAGDEEFPSCCHGSLPSTAKPQLILVKMSVCGVPALYRVPVSLVVPNGRTCIPPNRFAMSERPGTVKLLSGRPWARFPMDAASRRPDSLGPSVVDGGHIFHSVGLLRGQVVHFGAVGLHVVEFPGLAFQRDELPLAPPHGRVSAEFPVECFATCRLFSLQDGP